jgi:hypothetical protein
LLHDGCERSKNKKALLREKLAQCGRPARSFDESLKTALDFLENPRNLWVSPHLEHKRAVLKLAFVDRLTYVRKEGFKTPDLALPFKVLADWKGAKAAWRARGAKLQTGLMPMICWIPWRSGMCT